MPEVRHPWAHYRSRDVILAGREGNGEAFGAVMILYRLGEWACRHLALGRICAALASTAAIPRLRDPRLSFLSHPIVRRIFQGSSKGEDDDKTMAWRVRG